MLAAMVLGCASDSDPSVRAAAVRTLGFAVTFSTLMDVSSSDLVFDGYFT